MDAKVDDWVVTPRRGKAVEINALWYNALCVAAGWSDLVGDNARANQLSDVAARIPLLQPLWLMPPHSLILAACCVLVNERRSFA